MTTSDCQNATVERTDAEAKRGRGRPAKITLELIERIARLIAKGMTEEQACCRVGVNHDSFRTARHRNPEFETAIKASQAEFLDESLDIIGQGQRGWQGRAWILERRHKPQFGRNLEIDFHQKPPEKMSDEELQAAILEVCSPDDLKRIQELGLSAFLKEQKRQQEIQTQDASLTSAS